MRVWFFFTIFLHSEVKNSLKTPPPLIPTLIFLQVNNRRNGNRSEHLLFCPKLINERDLYWILQVHLAEFVESIMQY